ncbi:bifunctional DNA-formamidopyrimidine glycosylase/DNA-(apurinic or apyrimidinic site) lyase [uncultured Desulfuromusa sp.]|uniref:bifunctional DNA-formamidopyrimidine glycosylase/DNA-(apurinic or apyrimidinic site) lyase n=1 Tax=uncultured Desulfuromusa sp. TaxID=219183 RepID=UPI002AA68C39|nr:bifunctional DNA-formamidopyrimidine glycosylase/DNA-(apurinic or apyrimidinic site) lyase [uncultured Desulfuromusa sp.]
MPELPEVETTLRGIAPHITNRTILECVFRTERLRWPLDETLCHLLPGQKIISVERRAKYLLLHCDDGTIILHLGMSGSLRIVPAETTEKKHDHVDLIFTDGTCLRLTDPRKFGAFLYTDEDPCTYKLLLNLGPEPLTDEFNGEYLYSASRGKKQPVKQFIMDQKTVVGVGNIYANESLFSAGIRPDRAAGRIGLERYRTLAFAIKNILQEAIIAGGTTIQDFNQADGKPGYFAQQLQVYGRGGGCCFACGQTILSQKIGQRSTFYCAGCQS